jgi:D-3-phosphoglycerate dehydrogenase
MKKPKVLLLENVHDLARDHFIQGGFEVTLLKGALSEEDLIQELPGYAILGIRSKTQVTKRVFEQSHELQAMGCFCVGTNQVDLIAARDLGIPVFNAPFSNTRSVAEMVIGEIIMLARQLGSRNSEMHLTRWNKKSQDCFEVRGKTLGIVGYGNIGTQVSMLAESLGMQVVFYDVVTKLSLGNAKPMPTLKDLLRKSDFVTLHVPETSHTHLMIGAEELALMPRGGYLINASRGTVVDLGALEQSLRTEHLRGAAIDVFPVEPEKNLEGFRTSLQGIENVILTPHIGGATEEAQSNIGREVAGSLVRFFRSGSTRKAVNFPEIEMPEASGSHRLTNVHKNVPGVLRELNRLISETGSNIRSQQLATDPEVGYVMMDLDRAISNDLLSKIHALPSSLRTRRLE